MLLVRPGAPLVPADVRVPDPGAGEVRVRVAACGVCRTDLHVADGELAQAKLPLVLGHEVVGRIDSVGAGVTRFAAGARVGIPWLGWTCGTCGPCRGGRENLCERARFTGYQRDGGFAEAFDRSERHRVTREFVLELIAMAMPQEDYDTAIARFVAWGRYGHLFAYDDADELLTPA